MKERGGGQHTRSGVLTIIIPETYRAYNMCSREKIPRIFRIHGRNDNTAITPGMCRVCAGNVPGLLRASTSGMTTNLRREGTGRGHEGMFKEYSASTNGMGTHLRQKGAGHVSE